MNLKNELLGVAQVVLYWVTIIFLFLLSTVFVGGCTQINYKGQGIEFSRTAFGTQLSVSELSAKINPDGTNVIKIEGYHSDQVEALKAVAEGVAKGAVKGAMP